MVPDAIKNQRWGCSSADALMRLNAAVHALCDAGYRGDLKIWGSPVTQSADLHSRMGAPKKLDQAECLHNRLRVHNRDALRPGSGGSDEFSDMFAAEASIGGFDAVCVDRAELDRLLAASNLSTSKAERECEAWLRQEFAADPARLRRKGSLHADAKKHFGNRLSGRGFSRAWARVATLYGRDKAGHPKSNQSTK